MFGPATCEKCQCHGLVHCIACGVYCCLACDLPSDTERCACGHHAMLHGAPHFDEAVGLSREVKDDDLRGLRNS